MKLLYYISYGIWYAFSLLPLRVHYVFADCLYALMAYVVRYRHRVIWRNLKSSFPEKTDRELRRIEKDFYHWFCDYFAETVKLLTMSPEEMRRRMVFRGTDEINRCWEEGQSVGVFLGHYGQWEWITSLPLWVSDRGQCTDIYKPLENKDFDRLFLRVREKYGARCIPMAETLRRVVDYRRQGRPIVLGYISDQVPFWNNIHHWLPFLNHDTPVFTGAEKIMKRMGHAVFYADVRRIRRGYYECEMQLITREPAKYKDFELTDEYFRRLEASIRRDPAIYLWSHNRWKRSHEDYNLRLDPKTGRVDLRPLDVIRAEKEARGEL